MQRIAVLEAKASGAAAKEYPTLEVYVTEHDYRIRMSRRTAAGEYHSYEIPVSFTDFNRFLAQATEGSKK